MLIPAISDVFCDYQFGVDFFDILRCWINHHMKYEFGCIITHTLPLIFHMHILWKFDPIFCCYSEIHIPRDLSHGLMRVVVYSHSWRSLIIHSINRSITVTSQWARWRLKSPASLLFTWPFIQTQIKENFKAPRHWPLCGKFAGDRWIPRTNDQLRGKYFHLMTLSWISRTGRTTSRRWQL